ncbi:hypothetical protein Zmor_016518 [Zophobas morio]|uniref:Uncharacterized protein n=1 Tax=Zophobas morio TaxID=2755281 RepID=A0AA38I737_9CUCU|nr:hypothetical protein Zmor_016518 [Zophobas morio]
MSTANNAFLIRRSVSTPPVGDPDRSWYSWYDRPSVVARPRSEALWRVVREDALMMATKLKPVNKPLQKKWTKKNEHVYENLTYKKKDSVESKLKIVIDNFDRILDEYKPPAAAVVAATKIPKLQKAKTCSIIESKLQKAKTCSIIESKCILKKSLSQPLDSSDGIKTMKTKTKSLAEIPQEVKAKPRAKTLTTKTKSLAEIPQAKTSSKVKEVVQRINLLNKAKSTHDVSLQEPRKVSKIPVKTPALRKTFPSTPSGLNCLDRTSGSTRKNVASLTLAIPKRDFVTKSPKEKSVKEVVQKLEANKLGNGKNTYRKNKEIKNKSSESDLSTNKVVLTYLKDNEVRKLNYNSDDCSDDSGNISNENEMDCEDVRLEKIFFRNGVLSQLESQRDERLAGMVVHLQAHCRGYLARRRLAQRKLQDLAVRCIQRNVRKFLMVRDWPWWRLLVRVTPLLNVHRTEEELRMKTDELEALKTKLEKLESERTTLKHENDKLEAKVRHTLQSPRSKFGLAVQRP